MPRKIVGGGSKPLMVSLDKETSELLSSQSRLEQKSKGTLVAKAIRFYFGLKKVEAEGGQLLYRTTPDDGWTPLPIP